jgi:hypothetical protein
MHCLCYYRLAAICVHKLDLSLETASHVHAHHGAVVHVDHYGGLNLEVNRLP